MGMIYSYYWQPEKWDILDSKQLKQEFGGEKIIEVCYGEVMDYPDQYQLTIWLRESIFKELLNNNYKFAFNAGEMLIYKGKTLIPKLSSSIY